MGANKDTGSNRDLLWQLQVILSVGFGNIKMDKVVKFTKRYNLIDFLYYAVEDDIKHAIEREKQLKNWHREWKWNLILKKNPELRDLAAEWYDDLPGSLHKKV